MSFKEILVEVLKKCKRSIMVYYINTFIILSFYYLLMGTRDIIYPFILSNVVIIVYIIVEFFLCRQFYKKLYIAQTSPDFQDPNGDKSLQTIRLVHRHYIKKIYKLENKYNEKLSFFSHWIHNMKTSSTVIGLACEKGINGEIDENILHDIEEENKKLEYNLENGLNVLRLDDFSKDYAINEISLYNMVSKVVNSKKRDFIYHGVFPKVNIDKEIIVYTDLKWCSYIIEQIMSNAIKYSPKNEKKLINIWAERNENSISLVIEDQGIGMDKEDISRVFQPFFTGNNGRRYSNSTGIGLYMVKKISEKLNHEVEIKSQKNIGTTVIITFNKPKSIF
ncbi:sensor histidine kinase [Oceanirhabdus sp. W0125-5]|uniref:sensor histidine kinase n=1 Tax=Oceanirhabdus sp. W0125-5 TaxID=2999116 RepID=UPI0022F2EE57|nr:sensor histidine kinase [Oceanirhabdus sp. W0125-5]WBW96860.1 sensor histidine kinase [Oceanirhabdus sp. W0125-5]